MPESSLPPSNRQPHNSPEKGLIAQAGDFFFEAIRGSRTPWVFLISGIMGLSYALGMHAQFLATYGQVAPLFLTGSLIFTAIGLVDILAPIKPGREFERDMRHLIKSIDGGMFTDQETKQQINALTSRRASVKVVERYFVWLEADQTSGISSNDLAFFRLKLREWADADMRDKLNAAIPDAEAMPKT